MLCLCVGRQRQSAHIGIEEGIACSTPLPRHQIPSPGKRILIPGKVEEFFPEWRIDDYPEDETR
jgi:hypothetical protein